MAATAAYVSVATIPASATPKEAANYSNINATTAAFRLKGGKYGVTVHASTYGTVTLQLQAFDATTWLTALTAFAADGFATADLPPGLYRVALA
jgi:hypothetical protein